MQKDYRTINREVMTNTYELCKKINSLRDSILNSTKHQKVIYEKDFLKPSLISYDSEIIVSTKRTYEAASFYQGKKVAVLNFANNHSIGGAPYSAGAQEESLCRCSTLLPCLEVEKDSYYNYHIDLFNRGLLDEYGNDDIIYTPGIIVFKTDESEPKLLPEDEWYSVDVITCAAPEVKYCYDKERLQEVIHNRIKKILDVAAFYNVEVLILGAFGCGAFGNPPELVASTFNDLICHYNFKIVEFAVFTRNDTINYDVFKKILGNN